jgi:hypothetical protein
MNLLTIPLATLRKAVQLREQRDALLRELSALEGKPAPKPRRKRRQKEIVYGAIPPI